MNQKMTVTLYDEYDIEITVEGTFCPEEKPVFYLKNGDPGYPGSPAEFDIETIKVNGVVMDDKDGKLESNLYDNAFEKACEQYADQLDGEDYV